MKALPPELAYLPNAVHMQRILDHLKLHPMRWDAAWSAAKDAARNAAWNAAWSAAKDAARDAARDAAWDAAKGAAKDAARDAAKYAARDAAKYAARDAAKYAAKYAAWSVFMALIAFDDCAYLLDWQPEQIRMHIAITNDPAAILLLPASIAMEEP